MESQADTIDTSTILSEDHLSILNMAYSFKSTAWMSSWELSKAREEPVAVIGVKDLQLQVIAGADGWTGDWVENTCPQQPALVSVSLALRRPFKKASEDDDIAGDTIHYGLIKLAIMDGVRAYHSRGIRPDFVKELSMKSICIFIASVLIRRNILVGRNVNWSSIRIMLPKSSLRGAGTSLTVQTIYKDTSLEEQETGALRSTGNIGESCTLRLHDLIVPTIIGLLPKERTMKQNVVANIEIDRWYGQGDLHWDMQQIVVKTIEESSFQTLEALAERISKNIIRHSLIPTIIKQTCTKDKWDELADDYVDVPWEETEVPEICPIVKIKLEKPSIYIDTTPGVEMSMDIRPSSDSPYFYLWEGYKRLRLCPRPLIGTLTDWIAQEHPKGSKNGTSSNAVGINQKLDGSKPDLARTPENTKEIAAQPGENPENPKDGESPRLDLNQKLDGSQTDTSIYDDTEEETVALRKEHPETPKDGESSIVRDLDRKLKTLQRNIAQLRKSTQDIMAPPKKLDDKESSMLVEIGQKLDAFKQEFADAQKVIQEIVVRQSSSASKNL
ncbi:hypothetical protein BHYA_0067g00230 [Botrytis hyacinthi]|uniref:Dihydroneopterin aldolase/epimerase domain-containing protein n=1 Tax=Botrytis hyacinthi TaxID=278943 RepID=A0A4Z1GPG0_9HELO|nr:hypothetical protein BHYA_0067g00230 [Botrytis hyacinthi]